VIIFAICGPPTIAAQPDRERLIMKLSSPSIPHSALADAQPHPARAWMPFRNFHAVVTA